MQNYISMDYESLEKEYTALQAAFAEAKAKNLRLNMARGKPGAAQLDVVSDILSVLTTPEDCIDDGIDARNYGELSGLPSAKVCRRSSHRGYKTRAFGWGQISGGLRAVRIFGL